MEKRESKKPNGSCFSRSFTMSLTRDCICSMVLTCGSYSYMDGFIYTWNDSGILKEIMQHKLVFIEMQDVVEPMLALDNYRRACDCGRVEHAIGLYFWCQLDLDKNIAGKVGVLTRHIPDKGRRFLTFDALRQAAQCVGRVICSKADYGIVIFADKSRHDKRSKLPSWILSHLRDAYLNLSTDMALHIARGVCPFVVYSILFC
ncbi:hypothetical protein CRYUN_Cryun01aG0174700 [Craigia yunnanensis]